MFVYQFSLFLCFNPVIVIFSLFSFSFPPRLARLIFGQGSVGNVNKVFNKLKLKKMKKKKPFCFLLLLFRQLKRRKPVQVRPVVKLKDGEPWHHHFIHFVKTVPNLTQRLEGLRQRKTDFTLSVLMF